MVMASVQRQWPSYNGKEVKLNENFIEINSSVPYLFTINSFCFQIQKNFNKRLTQTRQVIERAFSLLKGKFRRLKYLHMNRIDLIPETILACCIPHNICLNGVDDDIENYILDGEAINNEVDIEDENEGLNAEREYWVLIKEIT